MINKDEHLCIIAKAPDCGCIIYVYRYQGDYSLRFIKQFLNDAVSNNLHVEIVSHDSEFVLGKCPHARWSYATSQMPSAEAIRRADEVYKAIQVMRELA